MKNKLLRVLVLSICLSTIFSCYPGDDVYIQDLDTITTLYEEDNFVTAPSSVMISWTVNQQKNDDGDDIPYTGEIDEEILNTTLDNFVELYGESNVYLYIPTTIVNPITPSNPNVVIITENDPIPTVDTAIIPSIVLRENTNTSIIYPPCFPGYWYWYCYPPVIHVDKYSVGTVILDLFDVRVVEAEEEPSWTVLVRGLLSSNESTNSKRTIDGINKAFAQSPYLK